MEGFYIIANGKLIDKNGPFIPGLSYHFVPRVLGGKGGFGSMLRAIGAQIEKTTSREACRDLSGRRMRDINNEKKLKEWATKAGERAAERDKRRREKRLRLLNNQEAKHQMNDPLYSEQKERVSNDLEDALNQGLQKKNIVGRECTASKRKAPPSASCSSAKRAKEWLGLEIDNLSDLDSDESSGSHSGNGHPSHKKSASCHDSLDNEGFSTSSSNQLKSDEDTSGDSSWKPINFVSIPSMATTETSRHKKIVSVKDLQPEADKNGNAADAGVCHLNEFSGNSANGSSSEGCSEKGEPLKVIAEMAKTTPTALDNNWLCSRNDISELKQLGLDVLKAELMSRGLKCGGTLEQRAERLFSVRNLKSEQYPASIRAKPVKK